ncbi:GGDEF domain-containing protein [Rubrivivax albus]|uniref:diguanylate cyclase n=1 Tax=Rubrivivax albus TaxID=2499835 RepID=A0A437K0N6_9BURK|nr:diguanylate cyclase [Rubrivivax albus]RVT53851.1 diguanylate cyclase [Rubrivivax albus]
MSTLPLQDADTLKPSPLLARLWAMAGERQGGHVVVKDAASGRILEADAALARVLRPDGQPLVGGLDADWCDAGMVVALRAADQAALARDGVLASEHRIETAGTRRDFLVLRLAGRQGGHAVLASIWIDLTPQRRQEQQLRQALDQIEQLQRANESLRLELKDQGLRDAASGLYTRSHFEEQLRREVDLSTREHREFALVFVAVDPLSGPGAALGEAARVRVLEALGRLLRGNTRAMDASCRYDEDRFAVLLSGVGLATAHSRMEGLRRQCATQIVVHDGQELGFTTSMGVASFPHTAHTQDDLVSASEAALAEARRRGGNHVTLAAIRFEP